MLDDAIDQFLNGSDYLPPDVETQVLQTPGDDRIPLVFATHLRGTPALILPVHDLDEDAVKTLRSQGRRAGRIIGSSVSTSLLEGGKLLVHLNVTPSDAYDEAIRGYRDRRATSVLERRMRQAVVHPRPV